MKKVAIFGSAREDKGSNLYNAVHKMAKELAKQDVTIITGGGPGIMEAANKGAYEISPELSEAQAIKLPFEESINEYVNKFEYHETFFTRLENFSEQADAFVVCPGGNGTLLELSMIFQLLQVRHLEKKPVVAVGRMWRELSVWFDEHMVEDGFIRSSEMDLIHFVDGFTEATDLLKRLLNPHN